MPRITEYGPTRPHLGTGALGYNPGVIVGEIPTLPDPADDAVWYVPYETSADPGYVQFKRSPLSVASVATSTLDADPTPGNKLLAFIALREATGVTISMSGTGWTLVESAYCGSTTDDWPCYLYERTVQPGDGSAWTATGSTGSGASTFALWLVEVEGVSAVDASDESSDDTTQPTMSLTPVTADPIIILSFVSLRRDVDTAFTPATGMTEIVDDHVATSGTNGPQVAINYQVELTPTGSYTVGSTWGTGNFRAVIAASFVGAAGDVVYLIAPSVNDGDDATFDYVDVTQVEFLRGQLSAAVVLSAITLRVGLENSGSTTIEVFGANESDFSDEVSLDSTTFSATGSYTDQEVAFTLPGTTGYLYLRFELAVAQGIHVHEVDTTPLSTTGVSDHGALTGLTDQDHPASAVSFDPTGLANTSATDVQEAIEDLDGAISGGGIPATIVDVKGDIIVATAADTVARLPVISGNGSSLVVASGASTGLAWQLNKYDATTAPTVNDDTGDGYTVGSIWIDTTGDAAYICADASSGAAVWLPFDDGGTAAAEPAYDHFGTMQMFPGWLTAAANWESGDRAIFTPFVLPQDMTAKKMWYVTGGTTSGTANLDLGIYNAAKSRLVSTGSTAFATGQSNTLIVIDIADTDLDADTLYYLGMAMGSISGTCNFIRLPTGANATASIGQVFENSAMPLPATATWAIHSVGQTIPLCGFTARSEVA
jgi:hypothetical protein